MKFDLTLYPTDYLREDYLEDSDYINDLLNKALCLPDYTENNLLTLDDSTTTLRLTSTTLRTLGTSRSVQFTTSDVIDLFKNNCGKMNEEIDLDNYPF